MFARLMFRWTNGLKKSTPLFLYGKKKKKNARHCDTLSKL